MMRTLYANSLHVYIYVYLAVCRSPGTRSLQCITIEAMSSRLRHWLDDPLVLLCVAAGLLAFVVQSGGCGLPSRRFFPTIIPSLACAAAVAGFIAGMESVNR